MSSVWDAECEIHTATSTGFTIYYTVCRTDRSSLPLDLSPVSRVSIIRSAPSGCVNLTQRLTVRYSVRNIVSSLLTVLVCWNAESLPLHF